MNAGFSCCVCVCVHVQLAREGYFSGQSYLNFNVTDASSIMNNFFAGLGFRTETTDGLMFFHKSQVRGNPQPLPVERCLSAVCFPYSSSVLICWIYDVLTSSLFQTLVICCGHRRTSVRCFCRKATSWCKLATRRLKRRRRTTMTSVIMSPYTTM